MTNDNDTLELVAYNMIEITMYEAIHDQLAEAIILELKEEYDIECAINASGRVATFEVESDESMQDIVKVFGMYGITEDIARIRIITDLEPQWQREAELWPLQ